MLLLVLKKKKQLSMFNSDIIIDDADADTHGE